MMADCETSASAAKAKHFTRWFHAFKCTVQAPDSGAPAHYSASLVRADATSFRMFARSIVAHARRARMAKLYASLRVPHVYFYGRMADGISQDSLRFLAAHHCPAKGFTSAAHWPMSEAPREFYGTLGRSLARY